MRTDSSRISRWPWLLLLVWFAPQSAKAQTAPSGFFTDPFLVLRVGGHQGPVRSMVFTPGGGQLLTGGMDKVIQVWNLDADRSGPVRTLRPPSWRGSRGQVNAMALSPRDDGGNQRWLAVAGFGVLADSGEILLIRYPGPTAQGTGDIEDQLPSPGVDGKAPLGHTRAVTSLAFTPDGRFLASASTDGTVRIWDIATKTQVALIDDAKSPLFALVLFANGKRLASGGEDGIVRLYDISNPLKPRILAQTSPIVFPGQNSISKQINALTASQDGRWVVMGTEGSALVRYNGEGLGGGQFLTNERAGPYLALAINPEGTRLASSVTLAGLPAPNAVPEVSTIVEIRDLATGQSLDRLPVVSNLVQALAFSPDGRRLVYSGGDAQSVFVKELNPVAPPIAPEEIKGAGSSLWDVGFRADSRAIRFARTRPAIAGQAADYEYFDLRRRSFLNPDPNPGAYRHASANEAGWTIKPVNAFLLDFRNDQNQGWQRPLDPNLDGRWWTYTIIPPGPGHLQAVAAVGTSYGLIVLWNLATGEKIRIFNGHSSAVYALASSPDGRWLLSGSADQTVRLWSLVDCDKRPPIGAKFQSRPDGSWVVSEITPGGFASEIGLRPGHVIEKTFEGAKSVVPSLFLPTLDAAIPGVNYTFEARMNGDAGQPLLQALTSKRNSPALSLFPGVDRRWVFWTPKGYYDSSADGDRKFLGWLTNRGSPSKLLAGSFDSIDKFEGRFRQPRGPIPNVIDGLLDTANPVQAEALAAVANPAQPLLADPITSRLSTLDIAPVVAAEGPVVANQPTIALKYRAIAQAGAVGISRLWVEVNGRVVSNLLANNAPATRDAQGQADIPIGPDRDARVSLVAIDERGVRREEPLDVVNQTPPPPRKSRLEIVAMASNDFPDQRFPPIAYAEDDAEDLARFLGDKLVDPATGSKFPSEQVHTRTLIGGKLARAGLIEAFGSLKTPADGKPLGPGDVVAIVLESHYLELHSKRLIATTDPVRGQIEPSAISATELADVLGELTRTGCRAIVLIDAVHEIKAPGWELDIDEWVRQLQGQSHAIAFIASDQGPSLPLGDGHRAFAQAVLDVLKPKNAGRLRKKGGPMSLFDFQRTVLDGVQQQTGRKQHAQAYFPDTISPQIPLLDPSPR